MNRKVKELAMEFFAETQKEFPEICFINIQEHPEQADRYWINVSGDMDEDREIQMGRFTAEKTLDSIVKHGYSFAIIVDNTLDAAREHRTEIPVSSASEAMLKEELAA